MSWTRAPFQELHHALHAGIKAIAEAELTKLAALEAQLKVLLQNAQHATTLKMPPRKEPHDVG